MRPQRLKVLHGMVSCRQEKNAASDTGTITSILQRNSSSTRMQDTGKRHMQHIVTFSTRFSTQSYCTGIEFCDGTQPTNSTSAEASGPSGRGCFTGSPKPKTVCLAWNG